MEYVRKEFETTMHECFTVGRMNENEKKKRLSIVIKYLHANVNYQELIGKGNEFY